MIKKFLFLLFSILLLAALPDMAMAAERPIQLYVKNEKVDEVKPIVKDGITYVSAQQMFELLGYKTSFDTENLEISAVINGTELVLWAGDDIVEFDDRIYYLKDPIPVVNGQVYLYLRLVGYLAEYSVDYDKENLTINMKPYGYGEDEAVKELLTQYLETPRPALLTSDNPERGYYNPRDDEETNTQPSEIPVRDFIVTIDQIDYLSASEATLRVTYIKNTEVLDQKNEYNFEIKKENGQWKIAREDVTSDFVDLPKDIDIKAAEILQKYNQEQAAVLSDLKTYYKAYSTEDLNLTLQYTAPSFIERWNTGATDWYRWEEMLKGHFEYSDSRYKLSEERVIFLGKKEAVVQGVLEWSDSTQGIAEGDDVFPALIYMEFANGHWNYSDHLSLDQDF